MLQHISERGDVCGRFGSGEQAWNPWATGLMVWSGAIEVATETQRGGGGLRRGYPG
jgi:hypothetical protein